MLAVSVPAMLPAVHCPALAETDCYGCCCCVRSYLVLFHRLALTSLQSGGCCSVEPGEHMHRASDNMYEQTINCYIMIKLAMHRLLVCSMQASKELSMPQQLAVCFCCRSDKVTCLDSLNL